MSTIRIGISDTCDTDMMTVVRERSHYLTTNNLVLGNVLKAVHLEGKILFAKVLQ